MTKPFILNTNSLWIPCHKMQVSRSFKKAGSYDYFIQLSNFLLFLSVVRKPEVKVLTKSWQYVHTFDNSDPKKWRVRN